MLYYASQRTTRVTSSSPLNFNYTNNELQIMACGINTEDFNNRKLGLRNLLTTYLPAIKKGRERLLEVSCCLASVLLEITVITLLRWNVTCIIVTPIIASWINLRCAKHVIHVYRTYLLHQMLFYFHDAMKNSLLCNRKSILSLFTNIITEKI